MDLSVYGSLALTNMSFIRVRYFLIGVDVYFLWVDVDASRLVFAHLLHHLVEVVVGIWLLVTHSPILLLSQPS